MKISTLEIDGAYLLEDEMFKDERGAFTETWEQNQFAKAGIGFSPSNSCFSFNEHRDTLRGLHFQQSPAEQAKLVTCLAGAIYDVILDLRKSSPTYQRWTALELKGFSGRAVFIPKGCAHGFLTVADQSVVSYLIEGDYNGKAAGAIRWNDPFFKITWPVSNPIISVKDSTIPDYIEA